MQLLHLPFLWIVGKWYGEIYLNDKGGDGTFMWGFTSGDILLVYNSGQRKYDSGGEQTTGRLQ